MDVALENIRQSLRPGGVFAAMEYLTLRSVTCSPPSEAFRCELARVDRVLRPARRRRDSGPGTASSIDVRRLQNPIGELRRGHG